MPTPGAWADILVPGGTVRTGGLQLPRHPAAGILDGEQDPITPAGDLTHTGVSGVVCRPALASRFSTMRSTMAGSTQATRLDHQLQPPPAALPPLLGHPADERGNVGAAALRGHDPLAQPIQVQQVGEQPVQLAGVGHQPVDQVDGVLLGQARPRPLEREADADDRGQQRAQLMNIQEGVLHLVERPQLPGGLPLALQRLAFALQRLAQGLLGQLLVGDVDVVALPVVGLAVLATRTCTAWSRTHIPRRPW